ncbi:MAG: SEC-C metal-binding domain-containing protein [Gallionella sp.]
MAPPQLWFDTRREDLSKLIAASVAGLYRFWSAVRRTVADPAIRREMPKIGRNKKCPCGSELKYKKCCGVTPVME